MGGQPRPAKSRPRRQVPETIVVQELANRMAERGRCGQGADEERHDGHQNQTIDADTAELIVEEFGHRAARVRRRCGGRDHPTEVDAEETLRPRRR
jgi:translation initiation factor IF-2